ncbi:MAG: prepilin-type N-terminal cleavage/methylation domain-containing protein [Chitinivibrionia bacterium]|nr:prepilin-type N-terminal cleavage/methylation domain-containing protein [Chitinivibrionia bacterium]
MKNNSGATLVELMVYMVVGLIVITAAFQSIARGTRGYQHGRQVSRVQGDARTGVAVIARDIATMGFKTHFITVNNAPPVATISDFGYTDVNEIVGAARIVPLTAADSQSQAAFFFHPNQRLTLPIPDTLPLIPPMAASPNNVGDMLEFFRIRVDNTGELQTRERVIYFLDETSNEIVRALFTWTPTTPLVGILPGNWIRTDETVIVSNAVALKFRLGRRGIFDQTSPAWNAAQDNWISSNPPIPPTTRRDQVRHVEVSILVRAETSSNAPHGVGQYMAGDTPILVNNTTDAAGEFRNHIHRLYRQTVEVPSNARPSLANTERPPRAL